MKKATPLALAQIALLFFLIVPQATTKPNCEIDEGLQSLMGDTFDRWQGSSAASGGQGKVYVSQLSFMDGITKTLMVSEEAALIDEAVKDGMQAAADTNNNIEVNVSGHTVPNTDANVGKLAEISFNPNLTPKEKYQEAVKALMEPHGVDVLISGVVVDTGTVIQVKPMGVSKPDQNIKAKDMSYPNRDELFTKVNGTLALTPKGREEIKKAVKDLLSNL